MCAPASNFFNSSAFESRFDELAASQPASRGLSAMPQQQTVNAVTAAILSYASTANRAEYFDVPSSTPADACMTNC
jgi:hypothetical protein